MSSNLDTMTSDNPTAMTREERIKALRELYARLPTVKCQRKCWNHCGLMVPNDLEAEIIEETRHMPLSIRPHKLFGGLHACTMLGTNGLCMAHEVRPLICRLWGAVPEMPCPYGCEIENPIAEGECWEIMREGVRIAGDNRAKLLMPYIDALIAAAKAAAIREEQNDAAAAG